MVTPKPLVLRGHRTRIWVHRAVADTAGLDAHDPLFIEGINRLVDPEVAPQSTLKDDPARSQVLLKQAWDRLWVVKWYFGHPVRTLLGHLAGTTPAWREWKAAELLHHHGRRCNRPLALIHPSEKAPGTQGLILPYVKGMPLDHFISEAPPACDWSPELRNQRQKLAAQIGQQLGFLLNSGLINRDHKLSNLIMDHACEHENQEPVIIDPLGIGRLRNTQQTYKMLAMLIRTTHRAGYFSTREGMTCLKALLQEYQFSAERPTTIARTARELVPHSRPASARSSADQIPS